MVTGRSESVFVTGSDMVCILVIDTIIEAYVHEQVRYVVYVVQRWTFFDRESILWQDDVSELSLVLSLIYHR